MQSKLNSLIESLTNIAVGFFVATGSQLIIFPWFGIHVPLRDNFLIGGYMTIISLIRSYILRRYFTKRTEK